MPLLGAHMSIAGGYYKAVESAAALGMETVQLFTKNNNQWAAKLLSANDVRAFRDAIERTGIQQPVAHDSYLINLASPNDPLWNKSVDAFIIELQRAEALGLFGVVMHPGSFVGSDEESGLKRIVKALDAAHRATPRFRTLTLLETTAGQGTNLGSKFEHLAWILKNVKHPNRVGVCVDSCHIFVAGYSIKTPDDYAATMIAFEHIIGLDRLRCFHLNDSKKGLGSRVDRHEHIGDGCLGLEPFRFILNDARFKGLPMYLETKKGQRDGRDLDAINLETLRSLHQSPRASDQTKQ